MSDWTSECGQARIVQGDCLQSLRAMPSESVHCCVTSPPYYGLRDYGCEGQIGLEQTPEQYIEALVAVFREVKRVLRDDGTLWLNIGDSYAGSWGNASGHNRGNGKQRVITVGSVVKDQEQRNGTFVPPGKCGFPEIGVKKKDLIGIPWRVAFALQADGWYLRQDIIWHKPNPMPESVTDRCTKAHEYVFLLSKRDRYYYDADAVSEAANPKYATRYSYEFNVGQKESAGGGRVGNASNTPGMKPFRGIRNRRSVWTVTTKPYSGAHFATMPPDLVEPCVKAGCPEQCCPMCGTGYERLIEKGKSIAASSEDRFATNKKRDAAHCRNDGATIGNMNGKIWAEHKAENPDKFLGWHPACQCKIAHSVGGVVLDPFSGSGTTLAVAVELGRRGIGCELNAEYIALAAKRINKSLQKMALFTTANQQSKVAT